MIQNNQSYRGGKNQPTETKFTAQDKESIRKIITEDDDGKELVEFSRRMGEKFVKDGLTKSQFRNIFSEARRIEAYWGKDPLTAERRLNLLIPKLAYQVGKDPHPYQISLFADVITEAITQVNRAVDKEKSFEKFMDLFEAMLAYHRSFGGI